MAFIFFLNQSFEILHPLALRGLNSTMTHSAARGTFRCSCLLSHLLTFSSVLLLSSYLCFCSVCLVQPMFFFLLMFHLTTSDLLTPLSCVSLFQQFLNFKSLRESNSSSVFNWNSTVYDFL